MPHPPEPPLSSTRPFGTATLTCLVVANMIGAGVFTTSGFTVETLGSRWLAWVAWWIGGGIAICGAIGYGRLIDRFPESGGEYVFLSRAIHPLVGYLGGWVSLIAGFSGAIALAATGMVAYLLPSTTPYSPWHRDLLASVVILLAALLHGVRVPWGATAQNLVVWLKLILLTVFLAAAGSHALNRESPSRMDAGVERGLAAASSPGVDREGPRPQRDQDLHQPVSSLDWSAMATSLVWISLSYSGFNAAVYVAEEAAGSVRQASLLGTLLVTILYLALNAAFLGSVPAALIVGQPDIATIVAREIGGRTLETCVQITIVLALWTSVSSMMMAGPRVLAKMADDGHLPTALRFRGEAPRMAMLLQYTLALLFVWLTSLRDLLAYLGLTLSISAAITVACGLWVSTKESHRFPAPGQQPPWLVRLEAGWWFSLIYVVATLSIAAVSTWHSPRQAVASLLTFAAGVAMYGLQRYFIARP